MKKPLFWFAVLAVLIALAFYINSNSGKSGGEEDKSVATDYKNVAYVLNGQAVVLRDGAAETEIAPGSASKLITRYFGNEALGDVNGDGAEDVAFLLTQSGGGSGTFYYAVSALKTDAGYTGTNGILLGDRIAPQTTEIQNGLVIVNYAERQPGEPMTARPSVGVSKYIVFRNGELVALSVQPGEGLSSGYVVMGEGVRSFKPCGARESLWVVGDSPAYAELMSAYAQNIAANAAPYTPIFATLIGRITPPPQDGFGADYKNAFYARELVGASATGTCR